MNNIPLTSLFGIARTSYGIQLGEINGKFYIVLYCEKEKRGFQTFDILDRNQIVDWILMNVHLPNTNPYGIIKLVEIMIEQAKRKDENKEVDNNEKNIHKRTEFK